MGKKKMSLSFSTIAIIIVIVLAVAGAGYYFYSKNIAGQAFLLSPGEGVTLQNLFVQKLDNPAIDCSHYSDKDTCKADANCDWFGKCVVNVGTLKYYFDSTHYFDLGGIIDTTSCTSVGGINPYNTVPNTVTATKGTQTLTESGACLDDTKLRQYVCLKSIATDPLNYMKTYGTGLMQTVFSDISKYGEYAAIFDYNCPNGCENDRCKPLCGNGGFFPEPGEECDDANTKSYDGCSADCKKENIVFLTSGTVTGDMGYATGGTLAGDKFCQKEACAAGLDWCNSYSAWLSAPSHNAKDWISRFGSSKYSYPQNLNAPYYLPNGAKISDNFNGLLDGSLDHAINVSADGKDVPCCAPIWTGTSSSGVLYGNKAYVDNCAFWTSRQGGGKGTTTVVGNLTYNDFKTPRWTSAGINHMCADYGRLYCFLTTASNSHPELK